MSKRALKIVQRVMRCRFVTSVSRFCHRVVYTGSYGCPVLIVLCILRVNCVRIMFS